MNYPLLRLKDVCKSYNFKDYALENVSFTLQKGDFLYVTGVSGAGKSTLLKLLFAIDKPSRGSIYMGTHDLICFERKHILPYRQKVSFIFQDFKLLNERTVYENISLPLENQSLSDEEIDFRVKGVLSLVGLATKANERSLDISSGEKQRVAIARAIVSQPHLLLADEPTGNLDLHNSRSIMSLLKEITHMGTTVIVATHDEFILGEFPYRTIELENGRMISDTGASYVD